jgi:phosphoglycolate phosphatase-like HAD superfamily hydrolase
MKDKKKIPADECYPPHLALFVGDRPEDKECAKAANIKFMETKKWRSIA